MTTVGEQAGMSAAERAEWLDWRRSGVGASEVAALVGASPWSTPFQVWLSKTAGVDFDETEPMRWGNLLEGVILDEVALRTGLTITGRQMRVTHPDRRHHLATLDAIAGDHALVDLDDALAVVEVKNTSDWSWEDVPLHYYLQGQWQMWVTGLTLVVFAVLHAGTRLELYEVERDDDDIAALAVAVDEFWFGHVVTRVEPPVSGQDLDALRSRARGVPGLVLEADEPLVQLVEQLRAAKGSVKAAGEVVDDLSARLLARLGTADELVDARGTVLATWKTGRVFDLDAAAAAHAEVAALCTRPALDETAFRKTLGRKVVDGFMRPDPDGARRLVIKDRKD